MVNPYAAKSAAQFWKPAIADMPARDITPIPNKRFAISQGAIIATAGSCFAQNVARYLEPNSKVQVLKAEKIEHGQPSFSARYGNIYTARQLVQLFDEAMGDRHPAEAVWRRADGAYIDGLRPLMFASGFKDKEAVAEARRTHLQAVRRVFIECSTFIFTLGLTEAWVSTRDGTAYPIAPGVVTDEVSSEDYEFRNFTYDEVLADVREFVRKLNCVNPTVRIVLTVSPVPLTATYTNEHILVATTHSKAILRAVCSAVTAEFPNVFYFPAYEIITGSFARGAYYDQSLRTVTDEGVAHVMRAFEASFLDSGAEPERRAVNAPATPSEQKAESAIADDPDEEIICDEEEIVKTFGFG